MKQNIKGNEYDYIVRFEDMIFEIIAIRKNDGKRSSITNLNTIISEIIEPVLNTTNIEETYLRVEDLQKGKSLFDSTIALFNDTYWVSKYLEKVLDEDFVNYYDEIFYN